jgi:nicotinamide-nucleotide amidase
MHTLTTRASANLNAAPVVISESFALLLGLSLGFALLRRRSRLMAAESCTGGLVSHWVTAIGGSSQWFDGGVVSYANAAKQQLLGVEAQTLQTHGAVSQAVAAQMAAGLQQRHSGFFAAGQNQPGLCSVAITGVAGPQGGQPGKPVGTVWFGWAGPSAAATATTANTIPAETQCRRFAGDRAQIQRQAAAWAIAGLVARLSRPAAI